jgi:hypothetical protein
MCLIISAPKGSMIPREILEDATDRNDDGWGLMYHDGRKIVTEKSHQPNAEAIYDLTKNNPHQTVVHLRMTTHGDNTFANTHPFEIVENRLYMMHNGIVDVAVPRGSKKSDTRVMVEDYIKPLVGNKPGRLQNTGLKNFIQNLIGASSNRLVFLNDDGQLTYFNKALGLEWKGLWCSNTYAWTLHSERKPKAKAGFTRSGGFDDWRYDSYWTKNTGTKHVPTSNDEFAEFQWADKNWQAQADKPEEDSEDLFDTEFGFIVPRWVAECLSMDIDEMEAQAPTYLSAVIENLRDTYIGKVV